MQTINLIITLISIIALVTWLTKYIMNNILKINEHKWSVVNPEDSYPDLSTIKQMADKLEKLRLENPSIEFETKTDIKIAILKQLEIEIIAKHTEKARLLAEIYCTLKNGI